jgi:hypothetical protein
MSILDYKNIHAGETAVIIGNGRSLEQVDLKKLSKYVTFGGNFVLDIYFPDYFFVFDRDVVEEWWWYFENRLGATTSFMDEKFHRPGTIPTTWDEIAYPGNGVRTGNLGSICLNAAYLMGITKAYLIGHDWGPARFHHLGMKPYKIIELQRPVPPEHTVRRHVRELENHRKEWEKVDREIWNLSPRSKMPIIPAGELSWL